MNPCDITQLMEELEQQELEARNGIVAPQVYEKLLAIYLCNNDLCNAKYLWKRIPSSVKTANPELTNIWTVARHMWNRDFPEVYKTLNSITWPDSVAEVMKQVQDKVRCRSVDLIGQAYSSITLETISKMTGLPPDICATACTEQGWHIDADTQMVHPVRPAVEVPCQSSSEDQLYKLTDFVSFLEN